MWKRARTAIEDASKAFETVVIFFILYSLLTYTVETLPGSKPSGGVTGKSRTKPLNRQLGDVRLRMLPMG